ncbi:MAG TPA: hypothetical protein VMF55_07260 [Solirubrobacterales bacterium]|nr:hypothetical protein [Solirubrobacterales bacterium]
MKIDWKKELSLPKLRRPSLDGPDLRMPKFLTDLYADLRDRHLLPLVALLIVAIVAAPILLSGGGEQEEPAAITPAGVEGEAKDAGLTVVPAEDGLRDYKRRLGHRVALNPFRQPPEPEAKGSPGEGSPEGGSESGAAPSSSSGNEVVTTTVGGVTTETVAPAPSERSHHKSNPKRSSGGEPTEAGEPTEPTAAEPTPSAPVETTETAKPAEPTRTGSSTRGPTAESSPTAKEVTTGGAIVGYTIDAEAGFVPKTTEKTDIAPMTKLPNKKHPLVLFMGLSKNHKRALFLMTSNVTAYFGGRCALDKQACQLVEVAPGKGVTFAAGYGNTRYKLHLKRIVPIRKDGRQAGSRFSK